jgi:hypothetical protein
LARDGTLKDFVFRLARLPLSGIENRSRTIQPGCNLALQVRLLNDIVARSCPGHRDQRL